MAGPTGHFFVRRPRSRVTLPRARPCTAASRNGILQRRRRGPFRPRRVRVTRRQAGHYCLPCAVRSRLIGNRSSIERSSVLAERHLHQINLSDPRLKELSTQAGRIATIVAKYKTKPTDPVVAALDELLGAVYALVSAIEKDFKGKLGPSEFQPVFIRAQHLANGQVRKDGNWMAGFHFNSAIFRISAVLDRLPKALGGHTGAARRYQRKTGKSWQNKEAHEIREEVNRLKHKASGIFAKRRSALTAAITAVAQLLHLAETLT